MHFFILKENLDKFLSIISRNISTRPQLPILSNVYIKAKNGEITLTTTDLEIGIIFNLGAKIEKEGEITVSGKLLSEFVTNLPAGKIEFILDGTNLVVKSHKTKAIFTTIAADDFPTFSTPGKTLQRLPFEKVKNAILRSVFAASVDEGRPILTGVKTQIFEKKITFAATDGYRLSKEEVSLKDGREETTVIVPAKSLTEVVRIAQETKVEEIGFNIINGKNQTVFILDKAMVFTRIIDGNFPDIEKIIPTDFKTRVFVEKEELTRAIKTASLFARTASNIIKVKIEKEGLRIKAVTPQIGEDEDFIEAKVEGEELEIAFNFRFLLEMLVNFPEEKIVFETLGPLNPAVFKPFSSSFSYLHIIMPVRVQG